MATPAPIPIPALRYDPPPDRLRAVEFLPVDRKLCLLALGILLALYLLLQNGLWAAGPDTAFYISVARNVVLGKGLTFNGGAVGRAPPGWPLLLAGMMKVSASFAFLNLVPMVCILASAGTWYRILRRMATPRQAFLLVVTTGLLMGWYSSTVQLRTEALFCLALSGAVLLGLQVAEGQRGSWRIGLLLALCVLMILTRYAGLAAWALVAAAILSGQRRVQFNRQWVVLGLSLLVTVGSYSGTRYVLKHILPKPVEIDVEAPERIGQPPWSDGESDTPVMVETFSRKLGALAYARNGLTAGQWVAGLFWMPAHIAVSHRYLGLAVNLFGWGLLAMYLIYLIRLVRLRNWLLIGVAAYCAVIILRWGVVNPRYLTPVAPLILLGVWMGMKQLAGGAASAPTGGSSDASAGEGTGGTFVRLAAAVFIASILLCNASLFAVDAAVARSGSFYHHYNAGELEDLVSAAAHLRTLEVKPGEVAVNAQFKNLNKTRPNGFAMRGLVMLLDQRVLVVPTQAAEKAERRRPTGAARRAGAAGAKNEASGAVKRRVRELISQIGEGPPNEKLVEYAETVKIRYYLYRPPASTWRAWHFRIPTIQRWMTGQQEIPETAGWILYEIKNGKAVEVPIPRIESWPRRVPGL